MSLPRWYDGWLTNEPEPLEPPPCPHCGGDMEWDGGTEIFCTLCDEQHNEKSAPKRLSH